MWQAHRPVFLNLARIRFPVGAVASIAHRISGIVLACALPLAALALERSLSSEAAFSSLMEGIRSPLGRAATVLIAWACAHHLLAGIRHLLSDVGIGASLAVSRRSAYAALIFSTVVAAASALLA